MKPVCFKCHRFFRMRQQGFYLTEGMPIGSDVKPGLAEPHRWKPYKIWAGDKWECEGCGATIISGFGLHPIAVQHEISFHKELIRLQAHKFQVNDC